MLARFSLAPIGAFDETDDARAGTGVIALPRQGQWRLAAAYARSDRPTGAYGRRECVMRSRVVLYSSRPALACIIGARRALTVETISSDEMPWR